MDLTDLYCRTCWIGGKCHRKEECEQYHSRYPTPSVKWPSANKKGGKNLMSTNELNLRVRIEFSEDLVDPDNSIPKIIAAIERGMDDLLNNVGMTPDEEPAHVQMFSVDNDVVELKFIVYDGEGGTMFDSVNTILNWGARQIDKSCLTEGLGDIIFIGKDNKFYQLELHGVIEEVEPSHAMNFVDTDDDGLVAKLKEAGYDPEDYVV